MTRKTSSKRWLSARVSIFAGANATAPEQTAKVRSILAAIRDPQVDLARGVDRVRSAIADGLKKKKVDRIKQMLPAATFSGRFDRRSNDHLLDHSGVCVVDLDGYPTPGAAAQIRDECSALACCLGAFVSPSAHGVKVLVAVDPVPVSSQQHRRAHAASCKAVRRHLRDRVGEKFLPGVGIDVARLCFLSSDPEVYVAEEVSPLDYADAGLDEEPSEASRAADGVAALDRVRRLADIDIEKARGILSWLAPDCDRPAWVAVGQALKAQFADTLAEDEAEDLFVLWSRGGLWLDGGFDAPPNWESEDDARSQWATFGRRLSGGVSFASVISSARKAGMPAGFAEGREASKEQTRQKDLLAEDERRAQKFAKRLRDDGTITGMTSIAREIAATDLTQASRDMLSDILAAQMALASGGKVSHKEADAAVAFKAADFFGRRGCPPWAEGWCFVNDGGEPRFYHPESGRTTQTRSFDLEFAHHLITPMQKAAGAAMPSIMPTGLLCHQELVPKVAGVRYLPGEEGVFESGGFGYANLWHPSSYPKTKTEDEWTSADKAAVDAWRRHIFWLLPDDASRLLLQFLARLVQQPGHRIRWAFLIQGPEGNGKSIITDALMRAVLGNANVFKVANSTLSHTAFNAWADGRQLSTVEELFVEGAKQHEVMNAVKAAITDDHLEIHPKGRPGYQIRNVSSYLVNTNRTHALPLSDGSRRWYIAECVFKTSEGFITDLGGPEKVDDHFARLSALAEAHGPALRGWLSSVDCSALPNRAPDSVARQLLVEASRSDAEQALSDAIDRGDVLGVGPLLLEFSAAREALMSEGVAAGGRALTTTIREMGFSPLRVGRRDTVKGRRGRWWVHRDRCAAHGLDPDDARRVAKAEPIVADLLDT